DMVNREPLPNAERVGRRRNPPPLWGILELGGLRFANPPYQPRVTSQASPAMSSSGNASQRQRLCLPAPVMRGWRSIAPCPSSRRPRRTRGARLRLGAFLSDRCGLGSLDIELIALDRVRQVRPAMRQVEQQCSMLGLGRFLRKFHAFDRTPTNCLGTHTI